MPKLNVEIPAVTGERDLDFVLANLRDVAALDALWGRTIKEVPRWLEEQLMGGVLRDECAELMTELDLVVDYDKDNGGFVWGPTGFDKKAQSRLMAFDARGPRLATSSSRRWSADLSVGLQGARAGPVGEACRAATRALDA
jgi:hypothetical protein